MNALLVVAGVTGIWSTVFHRESLVYHWGLQILTSAGLALLFGLETLFFHYARCRLRGIGSPFRIIKTFSGDTSLAATS
jgi:hypothetical protein